MEHIYNKIYIHRDIYTVNTNMEGDTKKKYICMKRPTHGQTYLK